jgi:hypothetical protein
MNSAGRTADLARPLALDDNALILSFVSHVMAQSGVDVVW